MRLYLMQHGRAKSKEEDPDRPLTDAGRTEVERVAAIAARAGVNVDAVLHSGKTRARQTAELLGSRLGPADVEAIEGVSPTDDPGAVAGLLGRSRAPTAVVGHLPHLSRLAGLLLTGSGDREPVEFRNGGLVCLERDQGRWRLLWALTPDVVVE